MRIYWQALCVATKIRKKKNPLISPPGYSFMCLESKRILKASVVQEYHIVPLVDIYKFIVILTP